MIWCYIDCSDVYNDCISFPSCCRGLHNLLVVTTWWFFMLNLEDLLDKQCWSILFKNEPSIMIIFLGLYSFCIYDSGLKVLVFLFITWIFSAIFFSCFLVCLFRSRCGIFNRFLYWRAKSSSLLDVFVLFELLLVPVGYVGIVSWFNLFYFSCICYLCMWAERSGLIFWEHSCSLSFWYVFFSDASYFLL